MSIELFYKNLSEKNVILKTDGSKIDIQAPKNILTPILIKEITNSKEELIQFLLKRQEGEQTKVINDCHFYNTAYSQKAHFLRYKFSKQWMPQNLCFTYDFEYFDERKLRQCIKFLIDRHECFKTVYYQHESEILQRIADTDLSILEINMYSLLKESNKDETLENIYIGELNRFINLEKGPLFNVSIAQYENEKWRVFITVEMSLIEGSSHAILDKEFPFIYKSFHANELPELPNIKKNYKDFAFTEKILLEGSKGKKMKLFWKEYFQNKTMPVIYNTDFPLSHKKATYFDYSSSLLEEVKMYGKEELLSQLDLTSGVRSSYKFYPGAMIKYKILKEELSQIKACIFKLSITNYSFYLSVFYLWLFKLSNNKELLIANCVSLRKEEYQNSIGFFTNIILTKIDLNLEDDFQSFTHKVGIDFIKCYENKEYPWEKVLEECNIPYEHVSHLFLDFLDLSNKKYSGKMMNQWEHVEGVHCILENNCIINEYEDCSIFHWIYSSELFTEATYRVVIQSYFDIIKKVILFPKEKLEFILRD